jgi:hypothetical protein
MHFQKFNFGIKKAGGYPSSIFGNSFFGIKKGWWIPTKHFKEFNFGIKKAGENPSSILKNVFVE